MTSYPVDAATVPKQFQFSVSIKHSGEQSRPNSQSTFRENGTHWINDRLAEFCNFGGIQLTNPKIIIQEEFSH